MLIKFLGIKVQQHSGGGCSACGRKRVSRYNMPRSKRIVLPNGRVETFVVGRKYAMEQSEADFLLNYTYQINGKTENPFVKA